METWEAGGAFIGERNSAQKSQAIESVFVRFVKREKRKTLMFRRVFGDARKETQPIDIAPKPQPSAPPGRASPHAINAAVAAAAHAARE
jgi:hypothetical protein